jgi:hypothetical protein
MRSIFYVHTSQICKYVDIYDRCKYIYEKFNVYVNIYEKFKREYEMWKKTTEQSKQQQEKKRK